MSTATINLTSFQLIKILREKVGEEQAESLATFVETKVREEIESYKDNLATKADIAILKGELKADIAKLETKIEATSKQTLIWMFGMLVCLLGLATGLIIHFAK